MADATTAREAILARIRRTRPAVGAAARYPSTPGPRPAVPPDRVAHFLARAGAAAATVVEAETPQAVVRSAQNYLEEQGLGTSLVLAADARLTALPWPAELGVQQRGLRSDDATALTVAYAGVAETGSLVLLSGPHTPTALNFLPDTCLCLVARASIVAHAEDVWERMRAEGVPLPRAMNFVTGPSRTADVEQIIQLGAHGPRRLLVIVAGDAALRPPRHAR